MANDWELVKEKCISEIKECNDIASIAFTLLTCYTGLWGQLGKDARKELDKLEDEIKSTALDFMEQVRSGYVVNDE